MAEGRARRVIVRLVVAAVLAGTAAGVLWLLRSPFFSIESIVVRGARRSDPVELLSRAGITVGTPLIYVDVEEAESAVLKDPWVETVVVDRSWPNTLVVTVEERRPVAWVQTADGWRHVAVDGVVLGTGEPQEGDARLLFPDVPASELSADPRIRGALEFVATLSSEPFTIRWGGDELVGEGSGISVRLGRPVEMEAKARVLAELLKRGIEPGSEVVLLAPTRPAVRPPGSADPEGSSEG